jgi:hypothetical protein
LPSVCLLRPSAKVIGRHLWTAADGSLPSAVFAEGSALGKVVFAECYYVPSVLHSINEIVTEYGTLPSAALDKGIFAEGPTKSTRQKSWHSTKDRIPVVFIPLLSLSIYIYDNK